MRRILTFATSIGLIWAGLVMEPRSGEAVVDALQKLLPI